MTARVLLGTAAPGRLLSEVGPWLVALLVVVVVAAVALAALRRLVRVDRAPEAGFTLQSLREMHARGDLSDEEFVRAKLAMIGRKPPTSENPPESEPDNRSEPKN